MVKYALSCILLSCPLVASARVPVLIDFTEEHAVDELKLTPAEAHAILSQLPGTKRITKSECKGETDTAPVVSIHQAVRADLLADGGEAQMLVSILQTSCEEYPRPQDIRTTLALVRGGKIVASHRGLEGAAEVALVTRLVGSDRDLAILVFPWHVQGVLGAGAQVWSAGPNGLVRLKDLGPVQADSCGLGDDKDIRSAVFFVRRSSPLDLLEKVYRTPCPLPEGTKPRWAFVKDGPLEP
jgi:hypothetical protein